MAIDRSLKDMSFGKGVYLTDPNDPLAPKSIAQYPEIPGIYKGGVLQKQSVSQPIAPPVSQPAVSPLAKAVQANIPQAPITGIPQAPQVAGPINPMQRAINQQVKPFISEDVRQRLVADPRINPTGANLPADVLLKRRFVMSSPTSWSPTERKMVKDAIASEERRAAGPYVSEKVQVANIKEAGRLAGIAKQGEIKGAQLVKQFELKQGLQTDNNTAKKLIAQNRLDFDKQQAMFDKEYKNATLSQREEISNRQIASREKMENMNMAFDAQAKNAVEQRLASKYGEDKLNDLLKIKADLITSAGTIYDDKVKADIAKEVANIDANIATTRSQIQSRPAPTPITAPAIPATPAPATVAPTTGTTQAATTSTLSPQERTALLEAYVKLPANDPKAIRIKNVLDSIK